MRKKQLGVWVVIAAMLISGCGKKAAEKTNEKPTEVPAQVTEEDTSKNITQYEGYKLVWNDEFSGTELNSADWNYETHEKGWVNNELQEYIKSESTVYVKDGKLVIKPLQTSNGYASGRVNTQGKHDFKYGRFEARCKVPSGQGYLPAFWMMPTDENLYGQWPRCGEIDIMEVMGQDTKKAYTTIHYGNPHKENQGTYDLAEGSFSESFHTYAVDWEPGKMTWYIDGEKVFSTQNWYTRTDGQGTITYPAPFDQPFYVILNLAIGGNWVGNPDSSTDADMENQSFEIDYVRVYQKDSYDENVKEPEIKLELRDPDETGNYINNAAFDKQESLDDMEDWRFLLANGGKGSAEIKDGQMIIRTEEEGTVDYSVQLIHPKIPFEKGVTYKVTFDAWASDNRSMKVAVKAPNNGWIEYLPTTTVDLTKEKQTFEFEFKMTNRTDDSGRLEYNTGASGSKETIYIDNVRVAKKDGEVVVEDDGKKVLSDGNYVYNGQFQEGENRVGFWTIDNPGDKAQISVSPLEDNRRLTIVVPAGGLKDTPVKISQGELAVTGGTGYEFSFAAEGPKDSVIKVLILGKEESFTLTGGKDTFTVKLDMTGVKEIKYPNITISVDAEGTTKIDNVKLIEDVLIKNGDFSAGFAGFEVYVDSQADASYVVDSQTAGNDNSADFTIKKTGGDDWRIQLKQNNVNLEYGKCYRLTFSARSNKARKIRAIMQGDESHGWAVYSCENIVDLKGDMEYQTFTCSFKMEQATDAKAFLSICLGKVDAEINEQHRVCIDNISLVEIDEKDM